MIWFYFQQGIPEDSDTCEEAQLHSEYEEKNLYGKKTAHSNKVARSVINIHTQFLLILDPAS